MSSSGNCRATSGPDGVDCCIFAALLQEATREVTSRFPEYFSRYPVQTAPIPDLVQAYAGQELLTPYLPDGIDWALRFGIGYLQESGVTIRRGRVQTDPVSTLLIQRILDAYSASRGDLPLRPAQADRPAIRDIINEQYSLKTAQSGVQYAVSKGPERALLIISSTGSPLNIWSSLLRDYGLHRTCLVVESRSGPLIEGGTPRSSLLEDDVNDIKAVLAIEKIPEVNVLAWCNGSRTAIELARSTSRCVTSVMLLAPTFHGAVESSSYPSPFEDCLPNIYSMLKVDPARGSYMLRCLAQVTSAPSLSSFKDDLDKRADAILKLPPQQFTRELFLPLSDVESFGNYMDRVSRDEHYDVRSALAELDCPILLMTGTHDAAINTQAARDLLRGSGTDVLHATLFGAGHHMQLLQYSYFKYALDCFLSRRSPLSSVRLRVERLAG